MIGFFRLLAIALLCIAMFACQENKNETILIMAENCMETYPDSAMRLLDKIHFPQDSPHRIQAKYALLKVQASHRCHQPLVNDSLINIAVDYYTRKGNIDYAAKALLYKGIIHRQQKNIEEAAKVFTQSEQWFEKSDDDRYKALLYNYYGLLMYEQGNYKEALHYFKKEYNCELRGDSIHYVSSTCGIIAKVYRVLGEIDSAEHYYKLGLVNKDLLPKDNYYMLLQGYANLLRKKKEYTQAETWLLECEQEMRKNDENSNSLYSSLATLYYDLQQYSKAQEYAERMLKSQDSIMHRSAYLHLYRIYRKFGDKEKAFYCHNKYREYNNDITLRMKRTETAIISYQVKTELLKRENEETRQKQWILLGCILLLSGGIYGYIKRQHANKQQSLQKRLREEELIHMENINEINEKLKNIQSESEQEIALLNKQIEEQKNEIEDKELTYQEHLQEEKNVIQEKDNKISLLTEFQLNLLKEMQMQKEERKKYKYIINNTAHKRTIEKQIKQYEQENINAETIQLLHYLESGEGVINRNNIPTLLAELLENKIPGKCEYINERTNSPIKRLMCYLIALGLDDEDMISRTTNAKSDTIRRYRKECLQIVKGVDR